VNLEGMGSWGLIGLGVDMVDVARLRQVGTRRPGLLDRLFCPAERDYAGGHVNPWPSLAARLAAKEATMKALGVGLGSFAFRDVEVVRQDSGRPTLSLSGRAAALAESLGVKELPCSLTHTSALAQAVVAAVGFRE
jgi:holo-[acyl-carrier protein] synthase